jgi:hypothetical protein
MLVGLDVRVRVTGEIALGRLGVPGQRRPSFLVLG